MSSAPLDRIGRIKKLILICRLRSAAAGIAPFVLVTIAIALLRYSYTAHHTPALWALAVINFIAITAGTLAGICIYRTPPIEDVYASFMREGTKHRKAGEWDLATSAYSLAAAYEPRLPHCHNAIAWIFATCESDQLRSADIAVVQATLACWFTGFGNASYLDTLAAAYAEAGDFITAIFCSDLAISLATAHKRDEYQQRRDRFVAQVPKKSSAESSKKVAPSHAIRETNELPAALEGKSPSTSSANLPVTPVGLGNANSGLDLRANYRDQYKGDSVAFAFAMAGIVFAVVLVIQNELASPPSEQNNTIISRETSSANTPVVETRSEGQEDASSRRGTGSSSSIRSGVSRERVKNESVKNGDQDVDDVVGALMSTHEGRAEVERIGGRDLALTRFQRSNGISDRIAEAAIKEWVMHHGSLDWNLEEVKAICLRNKQLGIPYDYLPESEK